LADIPLKARAIRLLARRDYARAELEQRLIALGSSREEVRATLDELDGLGLLSDTRYAQGFARQKAGQYSKRHIARQLKSKGVDSEAATAAIAGAEIDDEVALVELWKRRFGTMPANDREKARQVRFLQSRGFEFSAILKLLRAPRE
jgi:regulatory protein